MEISAQRAQQIIEGIRDLGCRLKGLDPKNFRVKLGGSVHSTTAVIDWYFSDQNDEASVNSKKAYKIKLVAELTESFALLQMHLIMLRILEWSAAIDEGSSEYRQIWHRPIDARGAKEEMAKHFADNVLAKVA